MILAAGICDRQTKRAPPFLRVPNPLEQPCQCGYHRGQSGMQVASQAKTVGRTGRLTGFEIEKDAHEGSPYLSTRGTLAVRAFV